MDVELLQKIRAVVEQEDYGEDDAQLTNDDTFAARRESGPDRDEQEPGELQPLRKLNTLEDVEYFIKTLGYEGGWEEYASETINDGGDEGETIIEPEQLIGTYVEADEESVDDVQVHEKEIDFAWFDSCWRPGMTVDAGCIRKVCNIEFGYEDDEGNVYMEEDYLMNLTR